MSPAPMMVSAASMIVWVADSVASTMASSSRPASGIWLSFMSFGRRLRISTLRREISSAIAVSSAVIVGCTAARNSRMEPVITSARSITSLSVTSPRLSRFCSRKAIRPSTSFFFKAPISVLSLLARPVAGRASPLAHALVRACTSPARRQPGCRSPLRASVRRCRDQSEKTASILPFSVCALNGLTM